MCRMIGYTVRGDLREDTQLLIEVIKELKNVAQHDPLLHGKSHGDGWGYIVVVDDRIYEYHSYKPIYRDGGGFKHLLQIVKSIRRYSSGIIHARRASKNTPHGLTHTHPYHFMLVNGVNLWIAYNGTIKLGETTSQTDTYFLGRHLASRCGVEKDYESTMKCLIEEYRGLKGSIVSGGILSMMIMESRDGGNRGSIILYPIYKTSSISVGEYYKHYLLEGNGLDIIASSSIIYSMKNRIPSDKKMRVIGEEEIIIKHIG